MLNFARATSPSPTCCQLHLGMPSHCEARCCGDGHCEGHGEQLGMVRVAVHHVARKPGKQGLAFKLQDCNIGDSLYSLYLPSTRLEVFTREDEGTPILRKVLYIDGQVTKETHHHGCGATVERSHPSFSNQHIHFSFGPT